jgi:hypothetical protein
MAGQVLCCRLFVCVAIMTLHCLLIGCADKAKQKTVHEPIGVVLTYQIVSEDLPPKDDEDVAFDIQRLVDALNLRIADYGVATVIGNDRFDVGLYGNPQGKALDRIKRDRIGVRTKLELRVLADPTWEKDRDVIELANNLPATEKDVKRATKKVAEWVGYSTAEFGSPNEANGFVKRMAGNVPEALVLIDAWNVKGEYLTSVTPGPDEIGRAAIHFSLNHQGAQRLRRLTYENLAHPATPDVYRHLGIILDKRLLSAPAIRTTISDRGMISGGSMTKSEIDQTIDELRMSSLPIAFQLVNEKRVAK